MRTTHHHQQQQNSTTIEQFALLSLNTDNDPKSKLARFEHLCDCLYAVGDAANEGIRQAANQTLQSMRSVNCIEMLLQVLQMSRRDQAQFLAASLLKDCLESDWQSIATQVKLKIHSLALQLLFDNQVSPSAKHMVITLVTRITKLGWFDSFDFHAIVDLLLERCKSETTFMLAMQILNDLTTEMTVTSKCTIVSRRISLNFREIGLQKIFKLCQSAVLLAQSEEQTRISLSVLEKCLGFEVVQMTIGDPLLESTSTTVPQSWAGAITQDLNYLHKMFCLLVCNLASVEVKVLATQCLSYLGNIRISIFDDQEQRLSFLQVFMREITKFLAFQSRLQVQQSVYANEEWLKEVVLLIWRLQTNFQIKDQAKAGDEQFLRDYIGQVHQFTVRSFEIAGTQSRTSMSMLSKLCYYWQRVVYEANAFGIPIKNEIQQGSTKIIESYLMSNLQLQANDTEEQECFGKDQLSQRWEDLDFFSKIMRQNTDASLTLLNLHLDKLLDELQRHHSITLQKQLAFIVSACNCLFTYGMVSSREHPIVSDVVGGANNQYDDFLIVSKICLLCQVPTQLTELEQALLQFMLVFKNQILTDTRTLLLANTIEESAKDPLTRRHHNALAYDVLYSKDFDNQTAFDRLAKMARMDNMSVILHIFGQRLVNNLIHRSTSQDHSLIVELNLDVLASWLANQVTNKLLVTVPIIQQLAAAPLSNFQILQLPSQVKQLGRFFSVLTGLWVSDDYINQYNDYLNQLSPQIAHHFAQQPQDSLGALQLLHILTGSIRALNTQKTFNVFFDWFYPEHLQIVIKGTLTLYGDNDAVMHQFLKLLIELVNNRANRLRFCTWSIDGLLIFKEVAGVFTGRVWDFSQKKGYEQKWKYVKLIAQIVYNTLLGDFVNFAISEYYSDSSFYQFMTQVLTLYVNLSSKELERYAKVELAVFNSLWQFFSSQKELFVLKFDTGLHKGVIRLLNEGLHSSVHEIQVDCTNCLNAFYEFLLVQKSRKPTVKTALLHQQATKAVGECYQSITQTLKTIVQILIFGDCKNIWVYNRCLHSCLALCQSEHRMQTMMSEVALYEPNPQVQEQIKLALKELVDDGLMLSLEQKSRDQFTGVFNHFREFVNDLRNSR